MLDAFYKEPERYAYTFQNYVFITRCLQYNASKDFEAQNENNQSRFRVCERSIFSDRKVFVDSLMDAKWLTNMEFHLYNCWFDALGDESLVPDAFVYLRASPETCKRRLGFRSRGEESGVTLEYLQQLRETRELVSRGRSNGVGAERVNRECTGRVEGYGQIHRDYAEWEEDVPVCAGFSGRQR